MPALNINTGLTFPPEADALKSMVIGSCVLFSTPSIPIPIPKDRFSLNWYPFTVLKPNERLSLFKLECSDFTSPVPIL